MGRHRRHHRQPGAAAGVIGTGLLSAEWLDDHGLLRIVDALRDPHGGPRIVGGAIRDNLLGLEVSDVDLATPLPPQIVMTHLENASIKAIPTGFDHGTITAVTGSKSYEITTLRRDVSTDGRRAIVSFATDWREDAARRDFTINALYADPISHEIFDYFGGIDDLARGTVRFIGNAEQRVAEDYLRILRFFRFHGRFGNGAPDDEALAACMAAAPKLTALSRERIAQEITRILLLPDPSGVIALMVERDIFTPFLPEADAVGAASLVELIAREQRFDIPPSLPARLIALLPKNPDVVDHIAARLKLSNRHRQNLALRLTADHPVEANILSIAYRSNVDCARDVALIFADDGALPDCLAKLENWQPPVFPVKGGDLIARGLTAGPLVAKTLQQLENRWIALGFPSDAQTAMLADQAVAEAVAFSKNA